MERKPAGPKPPKILFEMRMVSEFKDHGVDPPLRRMVRQWMNTHPREFLNKLLLAELKYLGRHKEARKVKEDLKRPEVKADDTTRKILDRLKELKEQRHAKSGNMV